MKYAVPVALLLLLTACGGGASNTGGGSSSDAPRPDASASASRSAASGAPAQDRTGNPVDAAAFCAFLAEEQPKLKSVGSEVGAQAALTIDLAGWIEEHPEQQPRTAADFDDAARRDCPDVRESILAATGHDTLREVLG
ncbi:hypothetical protein [Streptomyces sp. NPDC026673]|uniref:hypothetical protein n=1 Tax=Streptomyces sp. NPDC026673 TaxID=3155724 RepID=UPI0033E58120